MIVKSSRTFVASSSDNVIRDESPGGSCTPYTRPQSHTSQLKLQVQFLLSISPTTAAAPVCEKGAKIRIFSRPLRHLTRLQVIHQQGEGAFSASPRLAIFMRNTICTRVINNQSPARPPWPPWPAPRRNSDCHLPGGRKSCFLLFNVIHCSLLQLGTGDLHLAAQASLHHCSALWGNIGGRGWAVHRGEMMVCGAVFGWCKELWLPSLYTVTCNMDWT